MAIGNWQMANSWVWLAMSAAFWGVAIGAGVLLDRKGKSG